MDAVDFRSNMTPRKRTDAAAAPKRRPHAISRSLGSAVGRGTTADRVVTILVDYIRQNRLNAGTPLPSEIQISARFGVSRGVVREAYRSLSSAGLVEIANGRSPRVGHVNNRSLLQLVQHALSTKQASAGQILELRNPIEERAAELAAAHRTDEQIKELRAAIAGMRAAGSKVEAYVKADIRFHEIIGQASGNALFGLVGSALREAMGTSIRVSLSGRKSRADLNRAIATHALIADAIEAGKPKDAKRLMVRHFVEALDAVRRQASSDTAAERPAPRAPGRPRGAKTAAGPAESAD